MTRATFILILVGGLTSSAASRGDVELAPPPREIRPDGTRDLVPKPVAKKPVNPLETVERIIANSKVVGDKLAMTDAGNEVRQTQDTILKDIQSLIDQEDNPPLPTPDDKNKDKDTDKGQDKDKDKEKNKDHKPDDKKKDDGMPMGGMNDFPPPKKEMQSGGMDQQPMAGNQQSKNRRPRQPENDQSKQDDPVPKNTGREPTKNSSAKDPKSGGGMIPDPLNDGKTPPGKPSIPLEDEVIKDVWGHLPDKLRQQATQYYKQEFMPRYADLLKQYYSSLSEKTVKK